MKKIEGLPFVKFMMLLSGMSPLFLLIGIRGLDDFVEDKHLWITVFLLIVIPFLVIKIRIHYALKSNDLFEINISEKKNNKEYLFTYLFTVLIPLYSVSINNCREFGSMIFAICFVIFVLWNMNFHFINILCFDGHYYPTFYDHAIPNLGIFPGNIVSTYASSSIIQK